jgi:membrane protein YqaA with SNARE-associated domain
VLGERLAVFLVLVTIAKVGRYLAVIAATLWFT